MNLEKCFTLTPNEIALIRTFHDYCMYNASAYCAVCLKKLYPDQVKVTPDPTQTITFPCTNWGYQPLRQWPDSWVQTDTLCQGRETAYQFNGVIVCADCESLNPPYPILEYPGNILPIIKTLNYREKSFLSPVKLMTQMTRKSTKSGRIGHFEINGYMQLKHNYEFGSLLYGGMLGLSMRRGVENVNFPRVQEAYRQLCKTNPPLLHYLQDISKAENVVQYHVQENRPYVQLRSTWRDNILMPTQDIAPMAAQLPIHDLPIGILSSSAISLSHPNLMALLFPWLFINGKGHFSLVGKDVVVKDNQGHDIPENRGGIASANSIFKTFPQYIKHQLLNVDRRFARDPSFLFWAFDTKEKANIHSAKRHTVKTAARQLTKDDILDAEGNYDYTKVTIVPHNISSSYAYHRKHYLDLKTMCENLGPPQLFLTFSCDDKAPAFQNATGLRETWLDPVLFATHFQRKWNKFMQLIKKQWADKIGGITDWCYVMEIQDRGSPHKHLVLWTNKSADDFITDETIVCARLPPVNSPLHKLVTDHQIHRCDIDYCQKGDASRSCRFGYPKQPCRTAHFDVNDRAIYLRGILDGDINPYNPFLLACFETNMDIQINKGPAALHYLAKYLTKLDDDTQFRLQVLGTKEVTIEEHMKARVIGSIEATYDLLSLHQHQKSREVVWVPMNLPYDQSRGIRQDIQDATIAGSSKDIFKKSIVDHYEARTGNTAIQNMLLPDFIKYYYPCSTQKEKTDYLALIATNTMIHQPDYGDVLPTGIVSDTMIFRLRKKKCRFWRSRLVSAMADPETFYYQQILTKMPVYGRTFIDFKNDCLRTSIQDDTIYSWRDLYQHLIQNRMMQGPIDVDDAAAEYHIQMTNTPLTSSQQSVFDTISHQIQLFNNNIHWILGGAGTGKSFLLRKFSQHFTDAGYYVARLSPTGVAAYNIQGETIDRFFGFTSERREINTFKLNDHVKLFKKTILLIDEFSMLDKTTIENMSSALIRVTGRNMPFGGIATILFGDAGQLLPPQYQQIWKSPLFLKSPKFALQQSVRQQDDPAFLHILNKVRRMDVEEDSEVVDFIMSRVVTPPAACVHLFVSNQAAKYENIRQIRNLPGELHPFPAVDYPAQNQAAKAALSIETNLPAHLYLKLDCLVMLIRNLDVSQGWNNGTLAIVRTIYPDAIAVEHIETGKMKLIYPIQDIVPNTIYSRRQFPLRPAYASTIHKVQSLTLPRVAIHFNDMPYHGQLYVAMSRVRSSKDLYFFGINREDIQRVFQLHADCDAIQIVNDFTEDN